MKEPKPLLREGASDFERQLLGAVMRERPSPQLHSRMRRTIGLTGPIAWASSAKAMVSGVAGKSALGVAAAGLIALGIAGVRSTQGDADQSVAREGSAVTAEATTGEAVTGEAVAGEPGETVSPEAASRAGGASERASAAATTAAATTAAATTAAATTAEPEGAPLAREQSEQAAQGRELREEILLLDRARSALQRGSVPRALKQLDRYRQRFPSGMLSREATLLRQQTASARRASSSAR